MSYLVCIWNVYLVCVSKCVFKVCFKMCVNQLWQLASPFMLKLLKRPVMMLVMAMMVMMLMLVMNTLRTMMIGGDVCVCQCCWWKGRQNQSDRSTGPFMLKLLKCPFWSLLTAAAILLDIFWDTFHPQTARVTVENCKKKTLKITKITIFIDLNWCRKMWFFKMDWWV